MVSPGIGGLQCSINYGWLAWLGFKYVGLGMFYCTIAVLHCSMDCGYHGLALFMARLGFKFVGRLVGVGGNGIYSFSGVWVIEFFVLIYEIR